jgi:hypothetical protein
MLMLNSLMTFAIVLAVASPPASDPGRPLTPEEAMRRVEDAPITVEFGVRSVHDAILIKAGQQAAPWLVGHSPADIVLDSRPEPQNYKEDQFIVILSENAQQQLKRVGIHDFSKHFLGKSVQVTGRVSSHSYASLSMTGVHYELLVEEIRQFVKVE